MAIDENRIARIENTLREIQKRVLLPSGNKRQGTDISLTTRVIDPFTGKYSTVGDFFSIVNQEINGVTRTRLADKRFQVHNTTEYGSCGVDDDGSPGVNANWFTDEDTESGIPILIPKWVY